MNMGVRVLTCLVVAIAAVIVMVAIQRSAGTQSNALVGGVGTAVMLATWWLTGRRSNSR